jgi:hypothetical protein
MRGLRAGRATTQTFVRDQAKQARLAASLAGVVARQARSPQGSSDLLDAAPAQKSSPKSSFIRV